MFISLASALPEQTVAKDADNRSGNSFLDMIELRSAYPVKAPSCGNSFIQVTTFCHVGDM